MKEIKYLELLKKGDNLELMQILEDEIRKNCILKTNGKKVFNAINKLMKPFVKNDFRGLYGYSKTMNNQYIFTDTYVYAVINDNLGYEESKRQIEERLIKGIEERDARETVVTLEDILYSIKIKKNIFIENMSFDYKNVEIAVNSIKDIDNVKVNDTVLMFYNKNGEHSGVLRKQS